MTHCSKKCRLVCYYGVGYSEHSTQIQQIKLNNLLQAVFLRLKLTWK
jgi:hypothetical protein